MLEKYNKMNETNQETYDNMIGTLSEESHTLLENIDTEEKAYLLGWIASDGSVRRKGEIKINIHEKDHEILCKLRDIVCKDILIIKNDDKVCFGISSTKISQDVIKHLNIDFGKKDSYVSFPILDDNQLVWDFLRGYFDGDGCITKKSGYPSASITSNSVQMLQDIKKFVCIPSCLTRNQLEWNGCNAIDFLYELYKNASIYMERKHNLFLEACNWQPANLSFDVKVLPTFKWKRTKKDAIGPKKSRCSDSGYDLYLIEHTKTLGNVYYYDTGIAVEPTHGYYFDLVGRSSLAKTGWTLANNIGIIDASYRGSIIVALVKNNPESSDIELPARLVQIIPRQLILMEPEEVDELDITDRGEGGFGSTNK